MANTGPYFMQNQDYIAVGRKAIALLQTPGITTSGLFNQMEEFIQQPRYQYVIRKNTRHTLQQHIPGLCGMSDIPWKILWKRKPILFYKAPECVFDLYQQGIIDNGSWCDQISRTRPELFSDEIITAFIQAKDTTVQNIARSLRVVSDGISLKQANIMEDGKKNACQDSRIDSEATSFTEEREEIFRPQKVRSGQSAFAARVYQRYGERCAVCGLDVRPLLQAAHVRPVADNGSNDPENGLVLCANHHLAFDQGLFAIHPESMEICFRKGTSAGKLLIPHKTIKHLHNLPAIKVLQWRWERFATQKPIP